MISHSITPYTEKLPPPGRDGKPRFITGSDAHKMHIYLSTLERVYNEEDKYGVGTDVFVKHYGKGTIINYAEADKLQWDGMKCEFIEVWFHKDDAFELFHPSDIQQLN